MSRDLIGIMDVLKTRLDRERACLIDLQAVLTNITNLMPNINLNMAAALSYRFAGNSDNMEVLINLLDELFAAILENGDLARRTGVLHLSCLAKEFEYCATNDCNSKFALETEHVYWLLRRVSQTAHALELMASIETVDDDDDDDDDSKSDDEDVTDSDDEQDEDEEEGEQEDEESDSDSQNDESEIKEKENKANCKQFVAVLHVLVSQTFSMPRVLVLDRMN
jgi:hypothetical protein